MPETSTNSIKNASQLHSAIKQLSARYAESTHETNNERAWIDSVQARIDGDTPDSTVTAGPS